MAPMKVNGHFREEQTMKTLLVVVGTMTFVFGSLIAPATGADSHPKAGDHLMVGPHDLQWADVPSLPPGAKVTVIEGPLHEAVPFTIRLKFPADYKIPAHWHPAIEHVTVISGTFNMGVGDKLDLPKTTALSAGSVAIMQPKTHHFAWTKEDIIIQVHGVGPWAINYVDPADDPRKK
jgi:anti-sigma factor ChrR (cupin superfamily)